MFFAKQLRSFSLKFGFFGKCIISLAALPLILTLFATLAHSAEVGLQWDPNTEPELAGYKLYYGLESRNYTSSVDVGNQTTFTLSNLEYDTVYYFAVTACSIDGGESGYSEEISYSVPSVSDSGSGDSQLVQPVDSDNDGISDTDEINIYGTDPNNPDSDGDGFSDGSEISSGSDPLDFNSNPSLPLLETGEVSVDHNWIRVELNKSFFDPVVVAKPLSLNGTDPAVVRIRNVDSTGFEIRIQEWDYLDGTHVAETVSYIVMEHGSYILNDGTRVEAGRFETNATSLFETVPFSQTFQHVPVVLTMVSTFNGIDAVTTRVQGISTQGFEFHMQEQELNAQSHVTETVSYVAWEPSSGTVDGLTFEISKTGDVVQDGFQTIQFGQVFMTTPLFLADMQTTNGGDTANVRWQNKDAYSVEVRIDEEQSSDSETYHTTEVVGYMAFEKVEDILASSTIDTEAPMVSIAAPGYGATIDGTANVVVEASDDTAVAKVELYVDGTLHATDISEPFSFSFGTSGLSDGACELVAKAYDTAGNVGQSELILVYVNNSLENQTAPIVSIISPGDGVSLSKNLTEVQVEASDDGNIERIELYVDDVLKKTAYSNQLYWKWRTQKEAAGEHTISAKAYDTDGNMGVDSVVVYK